MTSVLLADIGGSTSRFAVCAPGGRPEHILRIDNETVSGLEAAIRRYLGETNQSPQSAVLAVAGPVSGGQIKLTNRDWRFDLEQVASRFGFSQIHAVNDFEAVAHALAILQSRDLRPLGRAGTPQQGPRAVLGPGTGLGVAALLPKGDDWIALASEGGHVSFGPAAADERVVFERLANGSGSVTAETVISGPGLERIYRAINPFGIPLEARTIVAQARTGAAEPRAAIELFVRLLGRFAGDIALVFKATGGVYIAGGVALKLGPLFNAATFRAAFENHPPYRDLLAAIPTWLITCNEPGLVGCAAVAEHVVAAQRVFAAG
ncbi:MAG TPA: glucokinase [Xanthobacteraceae bacterium]|nr:glucokinase [Xanthobacteraceae bacterium]